MTNLKPSNKYMYTREHIKYASKKQRINPRKRKRRRKKRKIDEKKAVRILSYVQKYVN